jgi:hypothetical protein
LVKEDADLEAVLSDGSISPDDKYKARCNAVVKYLHDKKDEKELAQHIKGLADVDFDLGRMNETSLQSFLQMSKNNWLQTEKGRMMLEYVGAM